MSLQAGRTAFIVAMVERFLDEAFLLLKRGAIASMVCHDMLSQPALPAILSAPPQ